MYITSNLQVYLDYKRVEASIYIYIYITSNLGNIQSPHMIYLVGGILDKGGPSPFRSNLLELVPVRLSHNPNKYRPYLKLSPHQFRI